MWLTTEKALKEDETTENDLLCVLLESNHKEIEEHGNSKNHSWDVLIWDLQDLIKSLI